MQGGDSSRFVTFVTLLQTLFGIERPFFVTKLLFFQEMSIENSKKFLHFLKDDRKAFLFDSIIIKMAFAIEQYGVY